MGGDGNVPKAVWNGKVLFRFLEHDPDQPIRLIFGFPFPIIIALLLNELRLGKVKRVIQTAIYIPNFISWVVLGGILTSLLSMDSGIVNGVIKALGFAPIGFLTDEKYFVGTMVVSMIWKTFGWNTIIYLAAITGIDPQLYEAATVDGANRWQKLLHITLPCIRSIIIVVLITRIGGLMQAGFEQIFVLYHPGVYGTADIIDTYVYRMGLRKANLSWRQRSACLNPRSTLHSLSLQTRQHAWQERREFTDEQGKAEKNQGFCRQQDF